MIPEDGDTLHGLAIDAIDDEGRGRATIDLDGASWDIAVRGALPGDVVDAVVERVWPARTLLQARRLGALGEGAGPLHVGRTCGHEGPCPACPLHGVDDGFVLALKRARVEQAAVDVGLDPRLVRDTVAGGSFRQKVKLVVDDADDGGLVLGHYVPHTHDLEDASGCALADDATAAAIDALQTRLEAAGLRAALVKAVILRRFGEGVGAVVVASGPRPVSLDALWDRTTLRGLSWRVQDAGASDNAIVGGRVDASVGAVMGTPLGGGPAVVVDSFCQADAEGAAWLVQRACAFAVDGVGAGDVVLDLYAGAGAFARGLRAAGARHVVAVESFPASVTALSAIDGVRAIGGRVEDVLDAAVRDAPVAAVVDPPKKGLGPVAARLAAVPSLRRIALVSCDVDAGLRDARALSDGGFVVEGIIPVDLFRGSAEVEVLTLLARPR
jgi:23S rRNA (uracil1939-C5)-methyltransferase